MYSRGELFMRSREGHFGVYFSSCVATRETNTKITLEWAHKQFATRVHTLFYFLHDITNPQVALKRGSPHNISVFHSLALRSADDVTIDWRWRHNDRQLRREHVTSDIELVGYRFHSRRYSRPIAQEKAHVPFHFIMTISGLVAPYSDIDLGEYWLRSWLGAVWTDAHLSLVTSGDFRLWALLQKLPKAPTINICFTINYLNFVEISQRKMSWGSVSDVTVVS